MNGQEYVVKGYFTLEELMKLNILPPEDRVKKGRVAVIECVQEIPCNPCAVVCKVKAIMKESISKPPRVDWDKCVGCELCISSCPGLAIFCIQIKDGKGYVSMPYELLPEPKVGDEAVLLDRSGREVGIGRIVKALRPQKQDPAFVITVETPDPKHVFEVRAVRIIRR
ncbi:MAG: 4Fe-4S binding protein [Candidatus Nezhaarchaeales archaeon]